LTLARQMPRSMLTSKHRANPQLIEAAMFLFALTAACKVFRRQAVADQTVRPGFPCQQICNQTLINLRSISRYAQYRRGLLTVEKPI
jgi:hypothetical protein